jgi:hypothetical protein
MRSLLALLVTALACYGERRDDDNEDGYQGMHAAFLSCGCDESDITLTSH